MTTISRFSTLALPLAMLALAAPGAIAGPLAPTRPSEVVTLYGTSTNQPTCAMGANTMKIQVRHGSDGSQTGGYVVPEGRVLVITDVAFRVNTTPPGADFEGTIVADQGSAPFALIPGGAIDGNSVAVGAQHFSQGPIVKGGTKLCFVERQGRPIYTDSQVIVHGFIAKDR